MHQQIKRSTPKRLTGAESHLRLFRLSSKGENCTCVGKVRNNLKTQHLNCSRRESNFPLVCRSSGCVMPIRVAIRSCAKLMHKPFADDLVLFAWERSQAVKPDEHRRLCRPRCSDRRAGDRSFSGSVFLPVLAEGRERCLRTRRRKSPNELLCAAAQSLQQQPFRRSSKRICCSAAAVEQVQASGQDALRKPPSQGKFSTYIQPGDDSEADTGLT